jgi:hypothetical protein
MESILKEITIGCEVIHNGKIIKVEFKDEGYEPIVITEDLLLEKGFRKEYHKILKEFEYKKDIKDHHLTIREGSNTGGRDWHIHIDSPDFCTIGSMDIQYLHQLQTMINLIP